MYSVVCVVLSVLVVKGGVDCGLIYYGFCWGFCVVGIEMIVFKFWIEQVIYIVFCVGFNVVYYVKDWYQCVVDVFKEDFFQKWQVIYVIGVGGVVGVYGDEMNVWMFVCY